MWSPVYSWPGVAVHAVVLPDGRVLTYGSNTTTGQQGAYSTYDIWDSTGAPDAGHMTLPNNTGTDIFCSSNVLLPAQSAGAPSSVFIAGGDIWTGSQTTNTANQNSNVLDVASGTLTRKSDMQRARWYSTSITLINGETYIQGGTGGTDRPEVRSLTGAFRLLTGADTSALSFYFPRNFVAPDGRVFGYDSNGQMYYVNTSGNGSISLAGQFGSQYASASGSAAMFRPGRILQIGGNSNGAVVIDISGGGAPVLTATNSLSSQRQWVNATILADGKVLATGGSQNDTSGGSNPIAVNNIAEIWNPTTGQWMQGPSASKPRLYHSNAVLLPDASVLVSGGGALLPNEPAANQLSTEIYYPPYFFAAGGQRASRPIIATAPDWVDIGTVIPVSVANAASVSRVTLVKTSATTHSFNMDQRFLDLTFQASGLNLSVQAPTRATDATPGYYMLFVFNEAGVPSVAKIVRMGIAPVANPATVPTLTNPGSQTTNAGTAVNLALSATDPNGDTLIYGASGLPAGLSLNTATGVISGAPTAAGNYNVTVTASDGINVASANFAWTVNAVNGVVIDPLPPVSAAQAGTAATFTASTQGGTNVLYQWSFGDGTGDTAWSPSATASHSFVNPGTYSVTLRVTDTSQIVQTRSFLQTVYLPATANKPSASSNIVIQTPASGNPRLWVVNQDNDSVSAFDTVTRAKLAEVAVGTAPRSIAVAANGLIWVTNKRSDSISVINPATNTVVNTIALPRASQPFGIAMSPTSAQAFVVLEATGQLLKFDTASYAQLASVSVGANPRQLSISADGASVYVSRFITPALPGESTATVTPTPSNGAEVVVISAAGMSFIRTIVLQHSDRADFENQGRGIPNYLGAATISPDGTQAWVPSKQDNIKRGTLRDGLALNFQNTVRAVSSRIRLDTNPNQEDLTKRVDHDNASVASAAAYDSRGVYLFVALETSREVAVVDAHGGFQVMRFDVGRAPQGLALSGDGKTLYVNNFMDRTVGVYDLQPLLTNGQLSVPLLATLGAVGTEKLSATVLLGKQHFYDARDPRLALDRYMSCASCHNDGGSDGRTWDFTGQGEGLRNTIALRGRAGAQGLLHWSANFDEVQDFEGQIRALAGGTGLMSNTSFNAGTRSQPLGDPKAGVSGDLDALAAYVGSLNTFEPSPYRGATGALSAAGSAGSAVFLAQNCAACHGGTSFTNSAVMGLQNIGTLKPSSGKRLGATLTGIDIPTLRDVWRTGPYLHDGSAATLDAAVLAHNGVTINSTDLSSLVQYLREIGSEETTAPGTPPAPVGLVAAYGFNEGTGSVLTDLSGKGNNGTISAATWTTAGKYGSALVFNGTSAVVTVPNSTSLQLTTGMTLAAWVYPTATPTSWRSVVTKNLDSYYLMASGGNNLPTVGGTWTSGNQNTSGGTGLAVNTWAHLAATFDGATVRLYVNGVQVASQAQTTPLATTTGTLQIGGDAYPGEFFAGRIDEVRIYNRALTAAEIGTDMNTPLAPVVDTTPPVLSNALPSGTLAAGTTQTTLSVTSNENATCRYATTAGTAYASMTSTFATTGGTAHSTVVAGLANGQSYSYYVRCQDSAGNANTADTAIGFAVATPDTAPPTGVAITAPAANATVTGTVSVSASASDNVGVVGVQFLLDGLNLGAEDTAAPYTVSWNSVSATNGSHTLTALARDAAGNQTTSAAVGVTVSNTAPDTTPPVLSNALPSGVLAAGTTQTTLSLTSNENATCRYATTAGTAYGSMPNTFNTTGGTVHSSLITGLVGGQNYNYYVRCQDAALNANTADLVISFSVPDTTAPTVSMSAPAAGATVSGTVSVSANASDNVGVVGVQFLLDGVNLSAEDTVSPYTVSWNTAGATNGAHTLTARARDAAGNQTTSVGVGVTVSNAVPDTTPPTVTLTSPVGGATGVSGTANVTATFSEALDTTTINTTTFELRDGSNALIAAAVTYNATTRVATLNPTPTLTQAAVYTATVKGGSTDPRVKDTAGNALAANVTWSFTIAPDVTPPTVTSTSPASGATGVSRTANITATFSEAMDATTISTSTVELRNPVNALVAAAVTYNATSRVVTLNPTSSLTAATTYTVTVKGGTTEPRVKDAAGNALANSRVWSFTTR